MPTQVPPWCPGGVRRWLVRWGVLAVVLLGMSGGVVAQDGAEPRVLVTTVDATITPVIADHIEDGIARAEREGYDAYVIRLDTPGGLDTSMRAIVQDILGAEVPVVVYISPRGARGASAGAIITFSAHVAAMAPGTTIGAATPVSGETGEDLEAKIVNEAAAYAEDLAELRGRDVEFAGDTVTDGRAASSTVALELGAVDLIASSTDELLEEIDGRAVLVGNPTRDVTLRTAGAQVDVHDLGGLRTIQQFLADPNIAFLLLSIGTLGLIYELASPGLGVGGALGLTFVMLAMFGLAVLPVDIVGVLFLALAVVLFVAELFAPGLGLAAAGGVLALTLSGIFLIDDTPGLELSVAVVLPTAIIVGLFVIVAGRLALRARRAPSRTTGTGVLVGQHVQASVSDHRTQAFVAGAWWMVRPRDRANPIRDGAPLVVVDVDGLELVVDPATAATTLDQIQENPT